MAQEIADSKLLDTWGSSGAKVEPDITKIIEGWQLGEQPPHEYMNWLQNTFGSKLNHILKNGVASWNNTTQYLAGSSVQHNGNVWLCKATNTNSAPTGLNANWENIKNNESANTINDLKTKSGGVINVLGYYEKGDGGSGTFYWDSTGLKSGHDGGTVIDPSAIFPTDWNNITQLTSWFNSNNVGTGVWVRINEEIISANCFGVMNDISILDYVTSDITVSYNDNYYNRNESLGIWVITGSYKEKIKPSVSFIFDDAYKSHYEDVLPLFESYGYPLGFAVCPLYTDDTGSAVRERLSTTELIDSQNRGVEIINHSASHFNLSSETNGERIKAEVNTAKQWFENRGLNTIGYIAASSEISQDNLFPLYSRVGYATTIYAGTNVDNASIKQGDNPYSLSRFTIDGVSSSVAIAAIKETIKLGRGIIFYNHNVSNPSVNYTALVEILNFLATIPDLVDVDLPKNLVSKFCGIETNKTEKEISTQVFNSTAGWVISPNLGAVITEPNISLTPTTTAQGTVTKEIPILPKQKYTLSSGIISSSLAGTITMGVHQLDNLGNIISGCSIETASIHYDAASAPRYSVEFFTVNNAVSIRAFYRVTPTVVGTLIIANPAIYTGENVLYSIDKSYDQTITEVAGVLTPDLSYGKRNFYLRADSSPQIINAPTNMKELDIITLHIRCNGNNRTFTFNSIYNLNPNTVYNTNVLGNIMIVQFKYYRGEWWQVADTAWMI